MATISTKRHSSQDHSNIKFASEERKQQRKRANDERIENLKRARAYINNALQNPSDLTNIQLQAGNARVILTRILKPKTATNS